MSQFINPADTTYEQKAVLLSEEFTRFLNRQEIYRSKNSTQIEYKNIYCTINIRNKQKRDNLKQLNEDLKRHRSQNITSSDNIKSSNKFTIINNTSVPSLHNSQRVRQSFSSSLSMITAPKFSSVDQAIYSEKMINESLLFHMQEQKISLNRIKAQLKLLNNKNHAISKKIEKFKTVKNISNCQRIYSAFCIDRAQKNYWQLIQTQHKQQERFEQISKKLKKSQQNLKDEYLKKECKKDFLEKTYYHKVNQLKRLQKLQNVQKRQNLCSLVNSIQSLIKLIEQNEKQFEQILLESCVKPRRRLKESVMMSEIKINEINVINEFEKKYNFKIETADRIIINIFNKLKQSQKVKVIQFDEFIKLRKEFQTQYRNLMLKESELETNDILVNQFEDMNSAKQIQNNKQYDSEIESLIESVTSKGSFNLNLIQFLQGNLFRFHNFFHLLMECFGDKKCEELLTSLKQILKINVNHQKLNNWNNLLKHEKFTDSTQIDIKTINQLFKQFFRVYNQHHGVRQLLQVLVSDKKSSMLLIYSHIAQIIKDIRPIDDLALRVIESLFQYCQDQFNEVIKLMLDCFIKCFKFIKLKSLQIVPIHEIKNNNLNRQSKEFYSQFLSNNNQQQFQIKNQVNRNVLKEQSRNQNNQQLAIGFNQMVVDKLLKMSKTQLLSINNNYKFKSCQ